MKIVSTENNTLAKDFTPANRKHFEKVSAFYFQQLLGAWNERYKGNENFLWLCGHVDRFL